MSEHSVRGGCDFSTCDFDDDELFDSFIKNYIRRDNSFPGRQPRSNFRNRNKFEEPQRPSSSGRFDGRNRFRDFSPTAKNNTSAEDILNRLKDQLRKESDMFFHSNPDVDYEMHHPRRAEDSDDWMNKGFEDMRSRHPMFRMPNWASEDDDVSNLASRMSHSPHFPSMMARRGGPWRERRNSGGSAMSGTSEEDSVDGPHADRSTAVRIPIRIEAEAPPGCQPQPPQSSPQQQPHPQEHPQQQQSVPNPDSQLGNNQLRKQPQYASRTTSDMDSVNAGEVPRNARSSSAPPDMIDPQHGARFVSKTQITPHNPTEALRASPVFNNVAKPFVAPHKAQDPAPIAVEKMSQPIPKQNTQAQQPPHHEQVPHQQYPQHQQPHQQHPQNQHHKQHQQPQHHQQHPEPQHHYPQGEQYPHEQHPHWDAPGQRPGVIRNIPIIFEGRKAPSFKEPSGPSRSPPTMASHGQHPGRSYWDSSFNDPHFGFGPTHGFSGPDPFFDFPRSSHRHQQPHSDQQYHPQPHPQQHERQPHTHQSQQRHHPEPHQAHPHQPHSHSQQHPQQPQTQNHHQPPKQATPPPEPKDIKLEKIAAVRESVKGFQDLVNNFEGKSKNKEFLYLDEMLTRALIQLDNIDPDGRDDVRQARKTLIKDINNMISLLEKKVTETPSNLPSGDGSLQDQASTPAESANEGANPQEPGAPIEQKADTQTEKVGNPGEQKGVPRDEVTETGGESVEIPVVKSEPASADQDKMEIDTPSEQKATDGVNTPAASTVS